MTSDKLLVLHNIQQQFRQDLTVVFNGHVYIADSTTLLMMDKFKEPVDKDGFPVPLRGDELLNLSIKLLQTRDVARKNYFERMSKTGIEKLTEVVQDADETME